MRVFTTYLDMITRLDGGDGIRLAVETHDSRGRYSDQLDREETRALCKALAGSDDARAKERAGIDALANAISGIDRLTKERDAAVDRAREAEERDANGAKTLVDAIKGIDVLTADAKALRAEAAKMRLARDAEAQRANAAEARADRAESDCGEWQGRALTAKTDRDEALVAYQTARRARDAAEESEAATAKAHNEAVKALAEANARVHELETSAEPYRWLRRDRRTGAVFVYDRAIGPGDGYEVVPLYLHPPKPAGKAVAWLVRYPGRSGSNPCIDEETADGMVRRHGCTKVPLYEAPPTVDVAAIRTVVEFLRGTYPTQTGEEAARILLAAIGEG